MTKRNQIYLSAFLMYLVAGFAGYLTNISSYWMILIVSVLLCGFTLINAFSKEENLLKETMIEWVSVCGFLGLQTVLTLCIGVFNVKYNGFFKYFNYGVQILGLLFVGYSIVKFVLLNTETYSFVKNKLKREKKVEIVVEKENEVALKVEEAIEEEKVKEEFNMEIDVSDVEVVGNDNIEPEEESVKSIELKKEDIPTPYMEEEI